MYAALGAVWTPVPYLDRCPLKGCDGNASTLHGWLQPRMSVQLELPAYLTLGAYLGDNIIHPDELETGITLGIRFWEARAKDPWL
jgi:hypothetical protein